MPDPDVPWDSDDPTIQALAKPKPLPGADIAQAAPGYVANALGITDAVKALRGEMTPDEAQGFALTAAAGLIPGAKIEGLAGKSLADLIPHLNPSEAGTKSLGELFPNLFSGGAKAAKAAPAADNSLEQAIKDAYNAPALGGGKPYDLSDEAIDKKLADNPGASIFDVAGAGPNSVINHYEGGAFPSDGWKPKLVLGGKGEVYPPDTFAGIPRKIPFSVPEKAQAAGFNIPLTHGTRAEDPFTEFKLPEELQGGWPEVGVHGGSPIAAKRFAGDTLYNESDKKPRVYPLVMRAQNPLETPDLGNWGPQKIATYLADNQSGLFPRHEIENAAGTSDLREIDKLPSGQQTAVMQNLRGLIKSKGFDSIKYKNNVEDPGHTSYIALDPSQLRSPWAAFKDLQSRNLLAGLAGGAVAAPAVGSQVQDYVKALQK